MSRRVLFRKAILWALALVLAIGAGGAIAAYNYVTKGDTLVELVRREAPRYLPRSRVDLISARIWPLRGEVLFHDLSVGEPGIAGPASLAYLPYVQVNFDPWAMLHGRFEAREVIIPRPTIRLRRRPDGTWNCQGLLADPWPGPAGGTTLPVRIKDGTVELIGGDGTGTGPGDGTGDGNAGEGTVLKVLTDVAIDVPAVKVGAPLPFELSAKGDLFERVTLRGAVDPAGRVAFDKGELVRLDLSDTLWKRLPPEVSAKLDQLGLSAGEVDANWSALEINPGGPQPVRCDGSIRLRRGIWNCPKLPFPINDVSVDVEIRGGEVFVTSAKGVDGTTALSVRGKFGLDCSAQAPFEVAADITGLHLDNRLRGKTPGDLLELWDLYFPEVARSKNASAGRINASIQAGRAEPGGPVDIDADVDLVDVAMQYKHFPYRVEHVQGRMHMTPKRLTLDNVRTTVGNKPLRVDGIVDNPGKDAIARLHFAVEALPVDDPLFLRALPPDVRKVVGDFKPTGTVRGEADLYREPDQSARRDPMGKVRFDARINLNPGCSATWKDIPYPVRDLTGELEIHPDLWIFRQMRGRNGQAAIEVDGKVEQVRRDVLKVMVDVKARNLQFSDDLRAALPRPWQLTWKTLNPIGAIDLDATVRAEPGKPEWDRVVIHPRPHAGVTLRFDPIPIAGGGSPQVPLELRMADVDGRFVFDTATSPPTTMTDVGFNFRGAQVAIAEGKVDVKDSGQFALGMGQLEVTDLLLDEGLRRMMPEVMATFARRLDDRKIPKIRANLALGWSGKPGESTRVRWDRGLVVLANNKLEVGGRDVALESIQGQLDGLRGSSDGQTLELFGDIALDSVGILGQQLTKVAAKLAVQNGLAAIDVGRGVVLGGALAGRISSTLEATPNYEIELAVDNADIQEYAKTVPGHQTSKGRVSGRVKVNGQGYDLHSLSGAGEARVVDGDLGTLPVVLRFLNALKLAENTRTAFDSAEVKAVIKGGETTLKPVHLIGNTVSLEGGGKLDVRGNLNLTFELVPGRDTHHIPILSDVTRELGGLFGAIRVVGPLASPSFRLEPLPSVGNTVRNRNSRLRWLRETAPESPARTVDGRKAGGFR